MVLIKVWILISTLNRSWWGDVRWPWFSQIIIFCCWFVPGLGQRLSLVYPGDWPGLLSVMDCSMYLSVDGIRTKIVPNPILLIISYIP